MGLNLGDPKQLFKELKGHVGHKIVCVQYGGPGGKGSVDGPWNIAIECETCYEVLLDADNPSLKVVKK